GLWTWEPKKSWPGQSPDFSEFETSARGAKNLCARFLNAQLMARPIRMVEYRMACLSFRMGLRLI
ncbi:MAG TPA: hypothetical protein DHV39_03900, partial [Verrucomicrobiales bacterium]|nr:hypothetical protein [Verrucomicrobiales bacterium]